MNTISALFCAAKAKPGPSTTARDVQSNSSSESDREGAFCHTYKESRRSLQHTGGVCNWAFPKLEKGTGRKLEHMKRVNPTSRHLKLFCWLPNQEPSHSNFKALGRVKSRAAIKSQIRCTHFLTCQHIAHSTNFTQLVDLVVSCGAKDLQMFIESASIKCCIHIPCSSCWFHRSIGYVVRRACSETLQNASVFSVMVDECTDITTIEELSVFCRWEEGGIPIECFLDILPLKKANAESICSALLKC